MRVAWHGGAGEAWHSEAVARSWSGSGLAGLVLIGVFPVRGVIGRWGRHKLFDRPCGGRDGASTKRYAQCGARTHDHQIKSLVLYRLS